jgi:hypothetical protein
LTPTPSLKPIGIRAPATAFNPLSVASRLYCAAAFLVSWISTLIPRELRCCLTRGLTGRISLPRPSMSKSNFNYQHVVSRSWGKENLPGFGQTNENNPHASSSTSNCPFSLTSLTSPCPASQGLQLNASPATSKTPEPPVILTPLSRWKPSQRHASIEVLGAGVFPSTLRLPKSVCVSSVLRGPLSWDFGAALTGWERDNARVAFWGIGRVKWLVRVLWAMHRLLGCRRYLVSSRMLGRWMTDRR